MAYLAALVIFFLITVVIWVVAVALFQFLVGSDLRLKPAFTNSVAILLVTLISFVPFPAGYLLSIGAWWLAANSGTI
jgi:hypothetical protein